MTSPELPEWPPGERGFRRLETTAVVGHGDHVWERAARDVLRWRVKTASGFAVDSTRPVVKGDHVTVTARLLNFTVVEPVEVVNVVEEQDRVGFAYRTLPGHPVRGEEAFIVHRHNDDVYLTVRSLTQPAPQRPWRALYPMLLIAQRIARRRYMRSLR